MKAMVTGGGTGGHIYPALAAASALRRLNPGLELLYGGRSEGLEERLAREAGLDFYGLPGRPLSSGIGVAKAVISLIGGFTQARSLLSKHRPDVVIGTGGYASTAIALAQGSRKKPLVLLEGNSVPGRTNRMLARSASVVCTAFKKAAERLPSGRVLLTGFPVRDAAFAEIDRAEARRAFGLDTERFTLLVTGGSQGASYLNEVVSSAGEKLTGEGVQILHQAGSKADLSDTRNDGLWKRIPYIEDMPRAIAAADLVVSRAGASTISELAAQGAAAILVPYPFAQGDHQKANALELVEEGRAVLAEQSGLTAGKLIDLVNELRSDEERRLGLGNQLKLWSKPQAAQRVAEVALALAEGRFHIDDFREN